MSWRSSRVDFLPQRYDVHHEESLGYVGVSRHGFYICQCVHSWCRCQERFGQRCSEGSAIPPCIQVSKFFEVGANPIFCTLNVNEKNRILNVFLVALTMVPPSSRRRRVFILHAARLLNAAQKSEPLFSPVTFLVFPRANAICRLTK